MNATHSEKICFCLLMTLFGACGETQVDSEPEKFVLEDEFQDSKECIQVRHTSYRRAIFIPHVYISTTQEFEFTYDLEMISSELDADVYVKSVQMNTDFPLSIKRFEIRNRDGNLASVGSISDKKKINFDILQEKSIQSNDLIFDMKVKSSEVEVYYDFVVSLEVCGQLRNKDFAYEVLTEARTKKSTKLEIWKI